MQLVMFSMTPLFADVVMGGAQAQLKKVALHCGERGYHVTILCTRSTPDHAPFRWHPRVAVVPLLRFKQPYPEPYATPIYNIAAAIQDVGDYLQHADRFYSHDGGLIFPYVGHHLPTVVSLRSVSFAETLQAAFLFDNDHLLLPSAFALGCIRDTVGRFFPGLAAKTTVIHNGFDWTQFAPTPPTALRDVLPPAALSPDHRYLLFPHRPEASKGFDVLLDVLEQLVYHHGQTNLRVLVPRWMDEQQSETTRSFYRAWLATAAQRGVADYLLLHPWVSQPLLPAYYSLGAVTLVIGTYVETFGNVTLESLGCGTPVIQTRVGPARDLLPDTMLYKVDVGDSAAIAERVLAILQSGERTPPAVRAYLAEHYSQAAMVAGYADLIAGARRTERLVYQPTPLQAAAGFRLPAWCVLTGRGIYHDFRAAYLRDAALEALLRQHPGGFAVAAAQQVGVAWATLEAWYRDGWLVPMHAVA